MVKKLQDLELLEHLEEAKKLAGFLWYQHSVYVLREAILKAKYPEGVSQDFMRVTIDKDCKMTTANSEDMHLLIDLLGVRSRREQRYIEGQRADLSRRVREAERGFPRHLLAIREIAQAQKNTDLVSLADDLLTIRCKEDDTYKHEKSLDDLIRRSDESMRLTREACDGLEKAQGTLKTMNKKPPAAGGVA